jgi:hypothetical protein
MALHRWLPVLFVLGSSVACSQTSGTGRVAQTKEKKKMDGLVIGTIPKMKAVLPGESFPVESVFENRGTAPLEMPNAEGPSPFGYDLLWEKDRSLRYEVSQDLRDTRRGRDIPPPMDRPPQTLAPGHSMQRDDDLAEFHNADFAPGKYLIRAKYPFEGPPEAVSALSPFTVLVPRIESFSSEVCGNRKVLVTAYAHRREDGGVLILQREASTDPRESIAFRRVQLEAGPPVQVAIAVDAMNAGNGRWFGWLRDGSFEAAVGWGNRVIVRLKPVRIGAAETVLLSPGFQVDLGVGLFGFMVNANGVARLKAVRASSGGIMPAFEVDLAAQGIRNVRWNYRADSGIAVFWQDAGGHVYRRSLDLQGKALDPAPVSTSSLVPVSWGVAPLGNPELLTAVRVPDGRYFFRDLGRGSAVAGASPVPPVQLAQLPDGMPQDPLFAFCTTAEGKTKIVTAGAGKIWATSVGESGSTAWQPVGDASHPLFLHAFTPRGRNCWTEWFEKDAGLRRAPLP